MAEEQSMEHRKMMVLVALAFVVSFAAAYFASGWVAAAVAEHGIVVAAGRR